MSVKPKDIVFVTVQLILFVCYAITPNFWPINLPSIVAAISIIITIIGVLVLILGLIQLQRNLTPFPSPKQNSDLVTNGVYKFIRHPIYTGIFTAAIGYSFINGHSIRFLISILLLVLFYFKSVYEEKLLNKKFSAYQQYQIKTSRFFPFT
jgi:protein-S-isoprenylcysteine O-methyltransferase Ste14